jgi:hypothetical protein
MIDFELRSIKLGCKRLANDLRIEKVTENCNGSDLIRGDKRLALRRTKDSTRSWQPEQLCTGELQQF